MKTLYVGNLPFSATEAEIRELFGLYGEVRNVNIVLDRQTGKPRGFAFVSMDDEIAEKAVSELNGQLFAGRRLQINEARPQGERPADGSSRPDRRDRSDRPFRPRSGFEGGRPEGDRPFRPRPNYEGSRPEGDRPFRPRPNYEGSRPEGDRYYPFRDDDEMGGEESAPSSFDERRPHTPHRSFNNRKTFRSRRDNRDSEDGFRRPRRPFRGGRQGRGGDFSSDDDED